ncbi:MAG: hypothetical protein K8R73_14135 [Clostridiales bacterium]|nr:hypothetical protein [Clostridiales bacterium]
MKRENRKRISYVLLVSFLLWSMSFLSTAVTAQEGLKPIEIVVDGKVLITDIAPIIEEGRTLVPLRAIFESLEAEVGWDPIDRKVTATKGETTIVLYIGNKLASVNGLSITLDVPPRIINDRTLVPLRFVSESFGADVGWDNINRRVTVASKETDQEVATPEFNPPDIILPDWVNTGLKLSVIDKSYDSAKIYMDMLSVQTDVDLSVIKPSEDYNNPWYDAPKIIFWTTGCDYSPYITFQGNQDGTGGCIGRSMVHIMNILKEREHPYTPDVSFWYLHGRQEELADGGPLDTQFVLAENGLCPEASSPSDYDKAVKKTNSAGNIYFDYSEMLQPNGWTNYLASYYKMKESDKFEPTIENIRYLLKNFGPLLAAGELSQIQGENPKEHHAVTIVGYDDVAKTVKCLNSWGDTWGPTGNGYFTVAYNDLATNFGFVRYYENLSVERAGTDQAYSARIHIETGETSRNKLKVTIGIDGRSPFTVWDSPNESVFVDYSKTLKLDVPLPIYAIDYWPPQKDTHWYVEVTNNSTWDSAELKEITFARLNKGPDGYNIETFESTDEGAIVAPLETRKFYVPKKDTLMIIPINPTNPTIPILPINP